MCTNAKVYIESMDTKKGKVGTGSERRAEGTGWGAGD